MREVAVVSAVRTPIGKAKRGNLKDTRPDDLLAAVLKEAVQRGGIDGADVDDLVVGTAMPEAEQGMNVARISGILAGLPDEVPAMTINRFCSSGLQSLAQGASAIMAGWQDVVLTAGVESMTQIAMGGQKPSPNPELMESRPEAYTPMGITAENVASKFEVSRSDQDAFSLESHERALKAIADGKFKDEILPIQTRVFKGGAWHDVTVDTDEGPRAGSTLEKLAKLRPAFKAGGSVTAANSSQVSDGAAAALLVARDVAEEKGLPILGVLKSYQVVGVPPEIMGIGPAHAIPKAVEAAGLTLDDIGLFEINEAFASQALYCVRHLELDTAKVNVNGGAIALGHPLGCTGARLTATLLYEMRRQNVRYGVVSMCIGGGMGAAAVSRTRMLPEIVKTVDVAATPQRVWQSWTDPTVVSEWFAPKVRVEARVGGPFEMLFLLSAPEGSRSEGCTFLELDEPGHLAFSWNAPPHLDEVRGIHTRVDVTIEAIEGGSRVTLTHSGYGDGGQWPACREYFDAAWGRVATNHQAFHGALGG